MGNPIAADKDRGKTFTGGGSGGGGGSSTSAGIPDFGSFEEVKAYCAANKIKDPVALGRVLAHAPADVQEAVKSQITKAMGPAAGAYVGAIKKSLYSERRDQFQQGKQLPGVSESGQGLGNREQTATAMAGRASYDTHQISQGVSKDRADYSYTPTEEQDVGWRPGDHYTPLGDAGQEQVDTLGHPIDYKRTDTTGVDAQKALLGTYQDLYKSGGLDAIDRARIAQSQAQRGTEYRGQIGAIAANAEEQGRFGGNAQLLSSMKAADTASRGRRSDDLETSALGLQRRNQLLQQQGQVAGDIQTGADAIGMFNTTGERDRARVNMQARNAGHSDEYAAQEARDRQNNAQENHGEDVAFGYEADKARHKADAATEAKRFNVTGDQGERGMTQDQLTAQGQDTSAQAGYGATLLHVQDTHDNITAQNKALAAGIPLEVAQLGTQFIPKPKR